MKIAWFTPFSNTSAIGRVSREICEVLAENNDVDIWTQHKENLIETNLNVIHFDSSTSADRLKTYDYIFYNVGNFAGNHREIYDMLSKKKGYVILHDQTMSGFWGQYYLFNEFGGDSANGFQPYKDLITKYYGYEAGKLCREAYQSDVYPIYAYRHMEDFKLIEPFMENALGVFTHAEFFAEKLKDIFNGEISFSYLPCKIPAKAECRDEKIIDIIKKARSEGRKILVSNGIVHPVKLIDRLTDVLFKNENIAERICYIVIGSYGGEYGQKLAELGKNKLKNCLYMMDYQPYSVMEYALENADMCVNMRYPNSEVCSLSLLEQMSYSKPVLVLNSGIYGEIPDECVIRIQYENVEKEIYNVLNTFDENVEIYRQKGINAGKFISMNCTAKKYAERLLAFADRAEIFAKTAAFENEFLDLLSDKLRYLGINETTAQSTSTKVVDIIENMFSDTVRKTDGKTLGVWAGFTYKIQGLNREGISRFIASVSENLVKYYDIDIEVWTYSFNEEGMKICFKNILDDDKYKNHIKIITEKNWKSKLEYSEGTAEQLGEINETNDRLSAVACEFSKADVFVPIIIYLDNVIGTGKRIAVPAHDMSVAAHYDEFIARDSLYKSRHLDILYRAENIAAYDARFFSLCKTVMHNHISKYVRNAAKSNLSYVYVPVNISEKQQEILTTKAELSEKFGLSDKYMFYPTQIRPYKNILTLLMAFNEIKNKYGDLSLVLTGNVSEWDELVKYIKDNGIENRVILTGNVTNNELYGLYKYADIIPVASKVEGGFPLQAVEGFLADAPVILPGIDVVEERIESCGFTKENCGVYIFDVSDFEDLAKGISKAIEDKSGYISNQNKFAKKLLSWSWKDAAKQYYEILFGKTEK